MKTKKFLKKYGQWEVHALNIDSDSYIIFLPINKKRHIVIAVVGDFGESAPIIFPGTVYTLEQILEIFPAYNVGVGVETKSKKIISHRFKRNPPK